MRQRQIGACSQPASGLASSGDIVEVKSRSGVRSLKGKSQGKAGAFVSANLEALAVHSPTRTGFAVGGSGVTVDEKGLGARSPLGVQTYPMSPRAATPDATAHHALSLREIDSRDGSVAAADADGDVEAQSKVNLVGKAI